MSERQVSIAVDAVGGEQSPFKILKGSEIFQETNPSSKLIFFGNKIIIEDSKPLGLSHEGRGIGKINDKTHFISSWRGVWMKASLLWFFPISSPFGFRFRGRVVYPRWHLPIVHFEPYRYPALRPVYSDLV